MHCLGGEGEPSQQAIEVAISNNNRIFQTLDDLNLENSANANVKSEIETIDLLLLCCNLSFV